MKKRPDGRYQKIITINGKKKAFYGKTIAAVNKKILAYEEEQSKGKLFSAVAEEWYDYIVPTLSPSTLKGYKPAKEDAVAEFGSQRISDITPQDVQLYINRYAAQKYSRKTVVTKLQILSQIFNYGILYGHLQNNPCSVVRVPRNLSKVERQVASPEDIAKIKASDNLLALAALYTGCRRGELLALSIDDIDFDNDTIVIDKSVYFEGIEPRIKLPKTAAGIRTIPLLKPLKEELLKRKIKGLLFEENGKMLTESRVRAIWEKFQEENGVECTLHQLRHAYATRLYELDVDVKSAQELLGHADVHTTQEIYTHLTELKRRQTAEQLKDF
ncbi:MAG: tyrosine-type recombinase/integrase [Oscillospiraceae bacterium]